MVRTDICEACSEALYLEVRSYQFVRSYNNTLDKKSWGKVALSD